MLNYISDLSKQTIAAIIAGVVLALLTAFVTPIRNWFGRVVISIVGFLGSSISVPWGMLIFLTLCTFALVVIVVRRTWRRKPSYVTQYTKGTFFGVAWRWNYKRTRPVELSAYCPHDDTRLRQTLELDPMPPNVLIFTHHILLVCETCRREYPFPQHATIEGVQESVVRQIERKIEKNEWQQKKIDD